MDSCDYHDDLIATNKNTRLEAAIGDRRTDTLTRNWLEQMMRDLEYDSDKDGKTIIELMAGYGRNFCVYKKCFSNIEMLDGSIEMSKHMPGQVKSH